MKKIALLTLTFAFFSSNINALSFKGFTTKGKYNIIIAKGRIKGGDVTRLKRVFFKLPQNKQTILFFNSGGGELDSGIRLGLFIKKHRIATAILPGGICASSCALAFLGGRDKKGKKLMIKPYSSQLGFHSFRYPNRYFVRSDKVQEDIGKILDYASVVQTPISIIAKMFKTSSKSFYWISNKEARYMGIKTSYNNKKIMNLFNRSKGNQKNLSYKQSDNSSISATQFVASYYQKINRLLKSKNNINSNKAYNSSSYINWLQDTIYRIYPKYFKSISKNEVESKVLYSMKNGKIYCMVNRYILSKKYGRWHFVKKIYKKCKNFVQKRKKLPYPLP